MLCAYLHLLFLGILTHSRGDVTKEKSTIPPGMLEDIVWEDNRSFEVGLTLQGQKMLVVGGFTFVKAMVWIKSKKAQFFTSSLGKAYKRWVYQG